MASLNRQDIVHKVDQFAVAARVLAVDCEQIANTSEGFTDIEIMEATNDAYDKFQNTINDVVCEVKLTEEEFESLSPGRRLEIMLDEIL